MMSGGERKDVGGGAGGVGKERGRWRDVGREREKKIFHSEQGGEASAERDRGTGNR